MKKNISSILTISLISFLFMFYGLYEACTPDIVFASCHSYFRTIPFTIWSMSLSIFLVSILAVYSRTEVFSSLLTFSIVFIPFAIILLFLAPLDTHDFITPFDKKITAFWLSSLFFLISLFIIAIKSWKLRRTEGNKRNF